MNYIILTIQNSKRKMTLPLFIGSSLIAFGPVLAISYLIVLRRSQLTILSLCSAWIFMMTLIFSSVIWAIIVPLQTMYPLIMVISAVLQELSRYGIVKLYYYCYGILIDRGKKRLAGESNNKNRILPINNISAAISLGAGIAAIYSFMLYGHVGSKTLGVGTYYLETCKSMSIYIFHAISSCLLSLLHIMWTILAFDSYNKKSVLRGSVILITHLSALLITLLNSTNEGCISSIIFESVLVVLVGLYTLKIMQNGME